jgi:F0F1-type ATP synthase beta subunit
VTEDDVRSLVRQIVPCRTATKSIVETGIKAVDLLCPLAEGGSMAQVGVVGTGRMALLHELRHALGRHGSQQHVFGLVSHRDPDACRGWDASWMPDRVGGVHTYWVLSTGATDPQFPALDAFDCVITCSPLLAVQFIWPAVDPEYSSSTLLCAEIAGARHVEVARRARALLVEAKHAFGSPRAVEMLASDAPGAAARAARAHVPQIAPADAMRLGRARRLQLFMSQPFVTASEQTTCPGRSVPLEQTLTECEIIMNGEVDDLPVEAFGFNGTLDDVRKRTESGEFWPPS